MSSPLNIYIYITNGESSQFDDVGNGNKMGSATGKEKWKKVLVEGDAPLVMGVLSQRMRCYQHGISQQ